MKKGVKALIFILFILIITIAIGFMLPKTGFVISQDDVIDRDYLESLRVKAEVGCLQNSQCSEGFECVANFCIDKKEINLCKERSLSLPARKLEVGKPINSEVEALIDKDLPYLLSDGELVEIIDGKTIEYFYVQTIFIGINKIEEENENYFIKKENNEPLYTYKLFFSNGVDFSSKNIQGQVLRILGKEYVIGEKSTNSEIELISADNTIQLSNNKNIKITIDKNGDVIKIEALYFSQDEMKTNDNSLDDVFNSIKFSFNSVDKDGFADIRIGENCL